MSLKNITYLDLIEACQNPGCLACSLRGKMVASYIRMLFHEHVNDPPSREKLRKSYGLCYQHIWTAIDNELSNALGVAIISYDVLGKLLQVLGDHGLDRKRFAAFQNLFKSGQGQNPSDHWLVPETECPVCLHEKLAEERILKTLIESIQKEELNAAIARSDGICLPHLRQLLQRDVPVESSQILLKLASTHWLKLRQELSEFIRKNDYRFSQEGFGEERNAWLRASASLTGNRPEKK